MAQKAVIAESEHVIAIAQDLGGDNVVVVFNPISHLRDGLTFWGDHLFLQQGMSAIGIVTLSPNWYPGRAMERLLIAVRERSQGRTIVTFGQGQGGYGALKFAAALQASAALSFSPQWSINPGDVASFDTRFTRYFDESLQNGSRIGQGDLSDRSFIFFDRMDKIDTKHVGHLAALRGVKTVVTPFSLDETILTLTHGRGAASLICLCTSQTPPSAVALRQTIRAARAQSSSYLNQIHRRLLLRMSQSRLRSSALVSRLLRKAGNRNPFYSALIAHASGNTSQANAELAKAKNGAFAKADLLLYWRIARDLQFINAELVVAKQILVTHSTDAVSCSFAIGTLIASGDRDSAHRELMRLVQQADAPTRLPLFVGLSMRLGKPDILEVLLSHILPMSDRVLVLFSLVDLYKRLSDRPNAFRTLKDLASCAESPPDLKRVATHSVELHEMAFALAIRERLLRRTPRDYLLALDVVEARIPSNERRARAELKEIMSEPGLPFEAWERASHLYERLLEEDAALDAIVKAAAMSGSGPRVRYRLAVLLDRKGLARRARAALVAILTDKNADLYWLRASGDLAFKLGHRSLAKNFAEVQFQLAPTDPACVIHLSQYLLAVGDRRSAGAMLSSLLHTAQHSASLLDQQWFSLAQGLYDAGEVALAKEAVAEAAIREPKSPRARELAATITLLEKLANDT